MNSRLASSAILSPWGGIDLHSHTSRSDGLLGPVELLNEMADAAMSLVAITDHDTLSAYRELSALGRPKPNEPRLIPAIEINSLATHASDVSEGELHILGLGVDPEDAMLELAMEQQRTSRATRVRLIAECLDRLGVPISGYLPATSSVIASMGRPHLARALIRAGHASSIAEAFDRWLSPGRPAYIPGLGMGTRTAIDLILTAGGLPVLAHFADAPERPDVIHLLKDWGLAGLEVYYSKWDSGLVGKMSRAAARLDLLATSGTDFHGDGVTYREALRRVDVPQSAQADMAAALDGRPFRG